MKSYRPFLLGTTQVTLVSINVVLISNFLLLPAFIVGFLISFVWTYNVKVALGSFRQRILYSLGAGVGTILGMYIGKILEIWLTQ